MYNYNEQHHDYFVDFSGDEVCCTRTGCYSDDPPFDHLPLPLCPEEVNPDYYLFTRTSQEKPEHFNHTYPPYDSIVIIHVIDPITTSITSTADVGGKKYG